MDMSSRWILDGSEDQLMEMEMLDIHNPVDWDGMWEEGEEMKNRRRSTANGSCAASDITSERFRSSMSHRRGARVNGGGSWFIVSSMDCLYTLRGIWKMSSSQVMHRHLVDCPHSRNSQMRYLRHRFVQFVITHYSATPQYQTRC